jgi:predicted glycoside hydrolase/deacetylase ChbG (UPF0249 family)
VTSLIDSQGRFLTPPGWLLSQRRPDLGELESELRAQMDRAFASGLAPSHLDLHTGIGYLLDGVFALSVRLAAEHGLAVRFPFGEGWQTMAAAAAAASGIPAQRIAEIADACRRAVALSGVPHPDRMIDAFPDHPSCTGSSLARLIGELGEGTSEILTHPAFLRGSIRTLRRAALKRARELAALSSPLARQALRAGAVELVSFRSLVGR